MQAMKTITVRRVALALGWLVGTSFLGTTSQAFEIVNRWSATQLDGGGLQQGDPVRLRWSMVPDGHQYERSANSQAIQFLDDGWNVTPRRRTLDFTNRDWWDVISNAYDQYGRVSGVTLEYVPEVTFEGVSTGMVGDIRIGGENIDGTPGGALADNVFPDGGDMRLDTTRENDGSVGFYFSTEPGLRNLVIHETGHGVGLGHAEFVNNSAHAIMEGGLRTDIWGLQFDDVYALNRQYGDPLEQNGGNDTSQTATSLGDLGISGAVSLGLDATDTVVEQFDDDWIGIDGRSDVDWFRFTTSDSAFANITLTPQGPTYETVIKGVFDASAQNNLILQLYSGGGTETLITAANETGAGFAETINAEFLPGGEYFVRVQGGRDDANQFYRLDIALSNAPAAGSSADLNLDGTTDLADWAILVANSGTSTAALSNREAFMLGDLDLDGDNDYLDFKLFKTKYAGVNGVASLASLTELQVPESTTWTLAAGLLMGVAGLARVSPRGARSPGGPSRPRC